MLMKITVVGAGAMGSLFAGYLAEGEGEIWIYDVWREHVDAIRKDGLIMTRNNVDRRVKINATCDPTDPGIVDLVLIFVKYGDTRQAVHDSRFMIGPHTSVLTLQNGIGSVDVIRESIPGEQILYGLTTLTSEILCPGHIEESFKGSGETHVWPFTGRVDSRTEQICSVFNDAGIHTLISENVELIVWKKLVVNACQNTLTAITRLKVGDLIDQPEAWDIFEGVVSEIVQVAQKKGLSLDEKEANRFLRQVGEKAREHFPSMFVDVMNKKKTEIDCLNGAIIREGERLGISTPFNRTIHTLIRIIENTYEQRASSQS
jgi:2-dehydropantoate 2-reductase